MIRKFRLYNSRQDLFDLTDNKDFIGFSPKGLGVALNNEFHNSGASQVIRKRELESPELELFLVIGYMQDNAYTRYTEFVQFLNHSPYVLEYEFDGRMYRRDCILSELSKEELRMSRTLQETLKLKFTSPFYIERTEQTQPYVPIEGKAGKIYEELRYERRIFESVPESYRAGDIWYWQGEDFPGRNLIRNSGSATTIARANLNGNATSISGFPTWNNGVTRVEVNPVAAETYYRFNPPQNFNTGGLKPGDTYVFETYVSGSGAITYRSQYKFDGDTTWRTIIEPPSTLTMKQDLQKLIQEITVPINTRDYYVSLSLLTHSQGKYFEFTKTSMTKGSERYPWSPAPEDLTNGQSSGYFIATKSNTSFDFNDFEFYNTTLDTQDKTYDYIYDYTYGPELYVEPVEVEFAYTYDYIYDDEEGEANSFTIDNNSVYMGVADTSPCEITIYGPCVNPHWDIMQGTKVVQSDGYNLTIPEGYRLVVSSHPNRQRAQLIALDGTVSNVYQQQDLSKTNFVRFPVGRSKILFFNYDRVTFKYREEYVVI